MSEPRSEDLVFELGLSLDYEIDAQLEKAQRLTDIFETIRRQALPRHEGQRLIRLRQLAEEVEVQLPVYFAFPLWPQNSGLRTAHMPLRFDKPNHFLGTLSRYDYLDAHGHEHTLPQAFAAPGFYYLAGVNYAADARGLTPYMELVWLDGLDQEGTGVLPQPYRNKGVVSALADIGFQKGGQPISLGGLEAKWNADYAATQSQIHYMGERSLGIVKDD